MPQQASQDGMRPRKPIKRAPSLKVNHEVSSHPNMFTVFARFGIRLSQIPPPPACALLGLVQTRCDVFSVWQSAPTTFTIFEASHGSGASNSVHEGVLNSKKMTSPVGGQGRFAKCTDFI